MWRLAERLFEVEERLDSSFEVLWAELTVTERDFFYFSIKAVLLERGDVTRVLEVNSANNGMVSGGFDL